MLQTQLKKILLVNPPVLDFSAYDFWLKPYGLLRVAGFLRDKAEFRLFDFMDRFHTDVPHSSRKPRADAWGRGEFYAEPVAKPEIFACVPRRFHRFGLPRSAFQKYLQNEGPFDVALIQTVMTYWYMGVKEVIEDIRQFSPGTKVVMGGVYATLCGVHAKTLGADLVIEGLNLDPLWRYLNLTPDYSALPLWDLYSRLPAGVLKLADGCPFKCTYCSVPQVYPQFRARPMERSLAEFNHLRNCGAENFVFYDDALLYQPERILMPFLDEVLKRSGPVNFHTPNALNARFISRDVARTLVRAGFKVIYLGFESSSYEWQKKTGGKVYSEELAQAVENLVSEGAKLDHINAYLIVAHPQADQQNVAASMEYASSLGIRLMLSEFSPIPGTPDGEMCRKWVDLDEPLFHNKTAFPIFSMGETEINRLKSLCKDLNQTAAAAAR